jgi:23S rRNA (cytosine1962-C5)-methyltransferase
MGAALDGSTTIPFCSSMPPVLPCVIFEDDDLLVVNKPAGINTHAPAPYAAEGMFEWLRNREPRWASLAIIHRLDKETSGVIVFAKTPRANRSLTQQFTARTVRKKYVLLTDREAPDREVVVRSCLVRAGERYVSRPLAAGREIAETVFKAEDPASRIEAKHAFGLRCSTVLTAEPLTGRTHQIRVQAAEKGFPILGDTLYGGTPAARVYLHAAEIFFKHPANGEEASFTAPVDFGSDPRLALRGAFIETGVTDAFRVVHGASDGWPGWYVDRLGAYLLSQSDGELSAKQRQELKRLLERFAAHGAYHKVLTREVGRKPQAHAATRLVLGDAAPERFNVRENGVAFELSFDEGYSFGLFLDQRDNRRRLLTGYVAPGFSLSGAAPSTDCPDVSEKAPQGQKEGLTADPRPNLLNTFAYTCGFSVCAAKAGLATTSLDLSRKYLEWGKRNFVLNQIDPAEHDFIYGDVFDWLRRLAKRDRKFDVMLLDPPTFSQSKQSGVFRAEKDYGKLVNLALALLRPTGVLFASTNAASWPAGAFVGCLEAAVRESGRKILQRHFAPQPPDFSVSRAEPAYLKTVWLRIDGG